MLYRTLADKVELASAKSLLLLIAFDSKKHSMILEKVGNRGQKPRMKPKDCEKNLGEVWKTVEALFEAIAPKQRIRNDEFSLLSRELAGLESTLGEESHMQIQLKTLQYMTKEIYQIYGVNLKSLKYVLEVIIRDEEHHLELLTTIRKLFADEQEQVADNTPTVKYQEPDAW